MTTTKLEVLTPANCQIIFIDHQPQMAFGVQSIDRQVLKNNTVALAKAAKVFNIPTIITTVETESFSGNTYPELLDVFPGQDILERTSMNSWDDQKVRDALKANGKKKVVVAGLWTEVCNNSFALCAMLEGDYEIYMVADASGGTSKEAHDFAMQRMIQAGVIPVTWQQVMLEWQRDWAHKETYTAVMDIVREHSGAYGMGVDYAYTMVHKAPSRQKSERRFRHAKSRRRAGPSSGSSLPFSLEFTMSTGLISLAAGVLIGLMYAVLKVRSPAPPALALIGLLGMLAGEQAMRHLLSRDNPAGVQVTVPHVQHLTGASS